MEQIGKLLLFVGVFIAAIGALLMISGKLPLFGKLPGDIVIERKNFTFYFPITTGIIISILLTVLLFLIGRR